MKELKSTGYYQLSGPEQYELYDMARDARMWQKTFAGLAGVLLVFALLFLACYSMERESKEMEVRKANERVLIMVEQLRAAHPAPTAPEVTEEAGA